MPIKQKKNIKTNRLVESLTVKITKLKTVRQIQNTGYRLPQHSLATWLAIQ